MMPIFSNWFRKIKVNACAKIIFTSIPKCGTHLLLRYFNYLGFKCGGPYNATSFSPKFYRYVRNLKGGCHSAWHYRWTEELADIIRFRCIKVVFLYRDPRAQIISHLHFIMKTPQHSFFKLFTEHLRTDRERIQRLIVGLSNEESNIYIKSIHNQKNPPLTFTFNNGAVLKPVGNINNPYNSFSGWLKDSSCYSVRYEDIVGPKGGGSAEKQLQVVRELMAFTGTPKGNLNPQEVADSLFDEHSNTFRKGQIDSWRKEFTPELHELFMQEAGGLLTQWGYAP